jgi:putative transposase
VTRYQHEQRSAGENAGEGVWEATAEVGDILEEVVRRGAQEMLQRALEDEVDGFLGRGRHERQKPFRGYRNGYAPERTVGSGLGTVALRAPRVREVPAEVSPKGYRSEILPRYQRRSEAQTRLFAQLYLEGLSSGDFEPVFRTLLGEDAPLSKNTILRLKKTWEAEYEAWKQRPLGDHQYAYWWFDGIYVGCGQEREKTVLLAVLGAREDGSKELLALEEGFRESTESWAEVLRSLRDRGLAPALLGIGDGALGAWAALDEVFPSTRHQRCWNHRVLNVRDQLPKRLQPEARKELRHIWEAPTRAECEARRDKYVAKLHLEKQDRAAATVLRDWEDFVTFYDFPQEHWLHLRTTNAIESVFAGVRLRTNVAKRMGKRENALYLVFKLVQRLGRNWRALNGGRTLMTLVLAGKRFPDGVLEGGEAKPEPDAGQRSVAA